MEAMLAWIVYLIHPLTVTQSLSDRHNIVSHHDQSMPLFDRIIGVHSYSTYFISNFHRDIA